MRAKSALIAGALAVVVFCIWLAGKGSSIVRLSEFEKGAERMNRLDVLHGY